MINNRVTIRLSDKEKEFLNLLAKESKLTRTEIIKSLLFNPSKSITIKQDNKQNQLDLLFLFNKISNNINQLAKLANTYNLIGRLSENTFIKINENLKKISDQLKL